MSRYIDATDIAKQIADFKRVVNSPNSDYMTGYLCALSVTEGMIANTPTADVVEVLRCKDCMYWTGEDYDGCCIMNGLATRYAKDYCSCGERKEK